MTENKLSHINRFQRFPNPSPFGGGFFMPESHHPFLPGRAKHSRGTTEKYQKNTCKNM